jgi:hypothetical protein
MVAGLLICMSQAVESTVDAISETYTRRRLITEGEPLDSTVVEFWSGSDKIYVELDVLGETVYMSLNHNRSKSISQKGIISFFEKVFEKTGVKHTFQSLVSEDLTLYFDSSVSSCSFDKESGVEFELTDTLPQKQTSHISDSESFTGLKRRVDLQTHYLSNDREWLTKIDSVTGKDEDTLQLCIETETNHNLTFDVSLDKSTDPSESKSARLIEHIGGGSPNMLEESDVYLIHSDDRSDLVTTVAADSFKEWYLVTPQDWEDYQEKRLELEVEDSSEGETGLEMMPFPRALAIFLMGATFWYLAEILEGIDTFFTPIVFFGAGIVFMGVGATAMLLVTIHIVGVAVSNQ